MLCSAFLCLCVATTAGALSNKPKVVVISLGGYGNRFLSNDLAPSMMWFKKNNWSGPKSVNPVFPPKGPVNHVTISTGYYAEDHGVINDCKYDEKQNFCYFGNHDTTKLPIWIENQQQGGISGVIDWPGVEETYAGQKAKHYRTYKFNQTDNRIATMIMWLKWEKNPVNLVMVYYNMLDKVLHSHATSKSYSYYSIQKADKFVGDFIERLETENIADDINVIILGSHGVLDVSSENGIDWTHIFNNNITDIVKYSNFMGANAIITPLFGKYEEVFNILVVKAQTGGITKYRVYRYSDIPNKWHLKSALKENDIFVVAIGGYFFWNEYLIDTLYKYADAGLPFKVSLGGYPLELEDNSYYMKTVFMAKGPRIKPGLEVPDFETIDVYPLLRNLLALPENEKKDKRVEEMNTAVLRLLKDPPT